MIRETRGSGGVSPTVYLPLAGGTMVGNVIFNDNVSVLLGTGSDGNLYHDGTNTYFKNATGHIYIENDAVDGDITFKVNDGGVDTTVMTIDGATSNVGIGTTGPTQALDVSRTTAIINYGIRSIVTGAASWQTAAGYFDNQDTGTGLGAGIIVIGTNYGVYCDSTAYNYFGGNVGIGTTTPDRALSLQMSGAFTNEINSGFDIRHVSSADMVNGFGTGMLFRIQDSAGVLNIIGKFGARRDGADDEGTMFLKAGTEGNEEFVTIKNTGNVGIGTTAPTISDGVGLHVAGKIIRIGTAKTPANAGDTGNAGEICWDAGYIYVCTATNTWERAAIATW